MKCWICKGPTPCRCVEKRVARKTFAELAAEDPQLLQRVQQCPPDERIDLERRGGLSWLSGCRLTSALDSRRVYRMDEIETIFDKLRKCMAGRVSESILIELDIAEIRLQQLLLREMAKERTCSVNAPAAQGVN